VAIWGNANVDPDYADESTNGLDKIEYRIPLDGNKGMADLTVALHYQTLPSRWMADLFANDTLELVGQFKNMYEGYNRHHEVINQLTIDSIDLSTTSVSPIDVFSVFTLSPNPVDGKVLRIHVSGQYPAKGTLQYQIIDLNGLTIQSGELQETILLHQGMTPGVFYFALYDQKRLVSIKPFVML